MQKNLRHHFRVPADFIAHLRTNNGDQLEADIVNVSRAGLMISCDRATLELLMPNALSFAPLQPGCVTVDFSLPLDEEGLVALSMEMLMVYTRRLSRDVFTIGLQFKHPTSQQSDVLNTYVNENKLRA
ncbi:PilZ domain-containing protein [Hahella sp. CCB-MM4]|uniref:PilZ domain-containing protein n=1 Tax=Hahella sp. (strain CCB-MM4) TaxID=1926491 RepID=UPI000B9A526D|nr:PilZ domain-containing protein [Hahella sp. CCB-MM4]OZG70562.1 PilZ domain-containing protein [Hahella sp. CCB-MM4]